MPAPSIYYLRHHEINKPLWDECIAKAANGLIYAQSFYLDSMCAHWDALVLNNYEAVMPLPWKKKWGIRYVYQAPFVQRLGIFGNNILPSLTNIFFTEAARHFTFLHYNINTLLSNKKATLTRRQNLIIDLHTAYPVIQSHYTKECRKNIRKAEKTKAILGNNISIEAVIAQYRNAYGVLHPNISEDDYNRFSRLLQLGLQQQSASLYKITYEGDMLFAAALLFDQKRMYYVMGAPTALGRKYNITYWFIDAMLQQYAGSGLYFDFEGSDIPNVASFYRKFGPKMEAYFEVKLNRLPWPLHYLKK